MYLFSRVGEITNLLAEEKENEIVPNTLDSDFQASIRLQIDVVSHSYLSFPLELHYLNNDNSIRRHTERLATSKKRNQYTCFFFPQEIHQV